MSETVKLPKHVAGVKIPKPLRRAAEAMLEQAATPAGRRLLAAALTAAAAALLRDLPDAGQATGGEADAPRPKPGMDMGALLGVATSVIGGLRAAGERRADAPGKPGEV